MPEIYFSRSLTSPDNIVGNVPDVLVAFRHTNGLELCEAIPPGNAYALQDADTQTRAVVRRINALPREERLILAQLANEVGDGTHQLAAFFEQHLSHEKIEQVNGLVGAGAAAAHQRLSGFQRALLGYQEAILAFNQLQKSGGPGIGQRRLQAEKRVRTKFTAMDAAYRTELDRLAPEQFRNRNRGSALSNADRALTLAARSPGARPDPRLNVTDTAQARRLGAYARFVADVGRAAMVVDAGLRIHNVRATHNNGGDWMRDGAVQMTGFGVAGAVGGVTGKYTVIGGTVLAAKAGLVMAGPIGWAVIGVIIGAGVLAGIGAGHYADKGGQGFASWIWDRGN